MNLEPGKDNVFALILHHVEKWWISALITVYFSREMYLKKIQCVLIFCELIFFPSWIDLFFSSLSPAWISCCSRGLAHKQITEQSSLFLVLFVFSLDLCCCLGMQCFTSVFHTRSAVVWPENHSILRKLNDLVWSVNCSHFLSCVTHGKASQRIPDLQKLGLAFPAHPPNPLM